VFLVRCSVDTTQLYPDIEAGLEIRKRYKLDGRKIVLYFGALGEANNIPVILRAAKHLQQNKDIVFMLIGDGMQRNAIAEAVETMKLTNVILHKAVPKDHARAYINAADLCIVTLLDIPLFDGALPTKLFDYMACNKPVLCGVGGEAKRLVDEAQAGLNFSPNDEKQLADLILKKIQEIDNTPSTAINSFEFIKNNYDASEMNKLIGALILNSREQCR
jgi:glycosyltransferase involved in cell wall biosynthesis